MTESVATAIGALKPALPLGVAYSGGADSTALLVACSRRWPGEVVALHVNHNLQDAAPQFEAHCRAVCDALEVPLCVLSVQAQPKQGESPEDAARKARYEALQTMATQWNCGSGIPTIALAQHADDQTETVMLALFRGGGLAGLSGMKPRWTEDGVTYVRPLLKLTRQSILQWLDQESVGYIHDPMNDDVRFARSALRLRVLPAVAEVYPSYRTTLARSAHNAAQAQVLLDEIAEADFDIVCANHAAAPSIASLQQLSDARMTNVLRYWLKFQYRTIPTQAQVRELLKVIRACITRGHRIHIKVGDGFVGRSAAVLTWYNPQVLRPENSMEN